MKTAARYKSDVGHWLLNLIIVVVALFFMSFATQPSLPNMAILMLIGIYDIANIVFSKYMAVIAEMREVEK
jgi:hypothetical protein